MRFTELSEQKLSEQQNFSQILHRVNDIIYMATTFVPTHAVLFQLVQLLVVDIVFLPILHVYAICLLNKRVKQVHAEVIIIIMDSTLNSHKLCAEKQMKVIKELIGFIRESIESDQANVYLLSEVKRLHQQVQEFKRQSDANKIKMKNINQIEEKKATLLIKSERDMSQKPVTNGKISKKPPIRPEQLLKYMEAREVIEIPTIVDSGNFKPHKYDSLTLNLPIGRRKIMKKPVPMRTLDYNKCTPLRNSNHCTPYLMPNNKNLKRKAIICFCYRAYTKGTDGLTYHTLCKCCGPPANCF